MSRYKSMSNISARGKRKLLLRHVGGLFMEVIAALEDVLVDGGPLLLGVDREVPFPFIDLVPNSLASGEEAGMPSKPGHLVGSAGTLQTDGMLRARVWLKGGRPATPPWKLAAMSSHRHFFCVWNTLSMLVQQPGEGKGSLP